MTRGSFQECTYTAKRFLIILQSLTPLLRRGFLFLRTTIWYKVKTLKIVYLGDIVAKSGREAVKNAISQLKDTYKYDVIIVNVDNAAHGFGCTPKVCNQLFEAGVTALVTGDHVWNQKDIYPYLNECKRIVRPLNHSSNLAGVGAQIIPLDSGKKILIVEVVGRVFMEAVDCPLQSLENILQEYTLTKNIDAIFVDIHAEATAEKQSFAYYFDGKVSAVIGSHTHVPTADERILPNGTAYQTDAGMCGDYNSVIGFDVKAPIERLKDKFSPHRLEPATNKGTVCGVYIETDDKTGLAKYIERIKITL